MGYLSYTTTMPISLQPDVMMGLGRSIFKIEDTHGKMPSYVLNQTNLRLGGLQEGDGS